MFERHHGLKKATNVADVQLLWICYIENRSDNVILIGDKELNKSTAYERWNIRHVCAKWLTSC